MPDSPALQAPRRRAGPAARRRSHRVRRAWSTWREVAGLAQAIKTARVGQHFKSALFPAQQARSRGDSSAISLPGGSVISINPSRVTTAPRRNVEALDLPFIVASANTPAG